MRSLSGKEALPGFRHIILIIQGIESLAGNNITKIFIASVAVLGGHPIGERLKQQIGLHHECELFIN